MKSEDLYIRLVDPTGKHQPVITYHRVHDRARFLEAQRDTHERKAKGADVRRVEVASEADYRKSMGYKEQAA
ncbi:hypothetical protein SAMN05216201_10956 [Pseudomonas linyingensis]|uniref:Uncharacterized protein n=1 Tax=Pseudomonas linyingensis TaxID=915471 RepID=A0A1H6YXY2_9PSED|nr:hypothetical protein [Pseudomonas linyingensis]SEJ46061.1 hypothetical protein SAMN05216201_10956 [Pseudomonas linyingensis]